MTQCTLKAYTPEEIATLARFGLADLAAEPGSVVPPHNHFTRDVKPLGQCPACDAYHERQGG